LIYSVKRHPVLYRVRFIASTAALEQVLPRHSRSSPKVFLVTELYSRLLEMQLRQQHVALSISLWMLAES